MHMSRIIQSSVACPTPPYFSTLSHKRYDFRGGKKVLNIQCIFRFSLQLLFETFLTVRRIARGIINVYWSSCKVQIYSYQIVRTLQFSRQIFETNNIKFHENPSSGSRAVPKGTHRRTDMTKLTVVFRNFANAPKTAQKLIFEELQIPPDTDHNPSKITHKETDSDMRQINKKK